MTRAGDEMILELASLLNTDMVKNAAKKDENDKDENDKDEKDEEEKKDEAKDKEKEKNDKKASLISVVNDLVKLAGELDDMGAEEASNLVDDALKTIVDSFQSDKSSEE
jgi:hypothetical protein